MSKPVIPLVADDISGFARRLSRQLPAEPPSHLSLMNMLARAAGFRNFQHLRAAHAASARLAAPPDPLADMKLVERALQQFDAQGRLVRWPSRRTIQDLALWAIWAHLPAERPLTEAEVNRLLDQWHLFGDAAILRRSLVTLGMATRRRDGTDYRRVEQAPPPEARALLAQLKARRP